MGSASPPLRMSHINGDPTGQPASTEQGTYAEAFSEQDLEYIQDVPIGVDGADHFYWARIYQDQGVSTEPGATFDVPVSMPNVIQSATSPVAVRVSGRGRGALAPNPTHHLAIYINNVPFSAGDQTVSVQTPTTVSFMVPASYFAPGTNTVHVRVLGDLVGTGDTDIFDIDKVEVDYRADRTATSDSLEFYSYQAGSQFPIDGFTGAGFTIYDVTEPSDVLIVDNAQLTMNGGDFGATMAADAGANDDRGFHYLAVDTGAFLKPRPSSSDGAPPRRSRATSQGADLLIVGPQPLLDAASALVTVRQAEGLRVVTAPLDQVYAEFSNGVKSTQALHDLVQYGSRTGSRPRRSIS